MEELYEKIVSSENAAKKRNSLLKELKLNIRHEEERNRQMQKDGLQLRKQLEQKVTELSDKQLNSKWLKHQEKIYKDQKEELEQQMVALKEREVELQQQLDAKRLQFCEVCDTFSSDFGLAGNGSARREKSSSVQLTALLEKQSRLTQRHEASKKRQQHVDKLTVEVRTLEGQLVKVMAEADKQTASLCEELEQTAGQEKEWLTLTHKPLTDTEFLSFQSQLDEERLRSSVLEDRCRCLQDNLRQLQQTCWQKKLQNRSKTLQPGSLVPSSGSKTLQPGSLVPSSGSKTLQPQSSGSSWPMGTESCLGYSKSTAEMRGCGGTGSLMETVTDQSVGMGRPAGDGDQSAAMEPDTGSGDRVVEPAGVGGDQSVEPSKTSADQGSHRKYIFKYKASVTNNGK